MGFLFAALAESLAGVGMDDFDAGAGEFFLKGGGIAGEGGEGSEVDGEDGFRAQEFCGDGGAFGAHGVVVADGEHGNLRVMQVADELHVGEHAGIAGMVEDGSVVDGDDKAGGIASIDDFVAVGDAGGVAGFSEGDGDVRVAMGAADVHADGAILGNAFGLEPVEELDHADDGRAVLFGDGDGVGDVVHVAVGEEEEVDLLGELETFGVFRVVFDKGIDEDRGSLRGLDEDGGVSEPGDSGAFEVGHGNTSGFRVQVSGYRESSRREPGARGPGLVAKLLCET
jgi:hypothetical protein